MRGRGIGRRLYGALEEALKDMGVLNLNACIAYPEKEDEYLTASSAEFHARLGYRLVGEFRLCGYKFGRWYNMIWMEKLIGEHTSEPQRWRHTARRGGNNSGRALRLCRGNQGQARRVFGSRRLRIPERAAMLRIITGLAGAGKTAKIMEEIRADVAAKLADGCCSCRSSTATSRARAAGVAGPSMALYAEVLSFTGVARRVEAELGPGSRRALTAGGRLLCMALALESVFTQLHVYGPARRSGEGAAAAALGAGRAGRRRGDARRAHGSRRTQRRRAGREAALTGPHLGRLFRRRGLGAHGRCRPPHAPGGQAGVQRLRPQRLGVHRRFTDFTAQEKRIGPGPHPPCGRDNLPDAGLGRARQRAL